MKKPIVLIAPQFSSESAILDAIPRRKALRAVNAVIYGYTDGRVSGKLRPRAPESDRLNSVKDYTYTQ